MEEPPLEQKLYSTDHIQTFIIHLFRSEAGREEALRGRLDVTAGGAIVVTSSIISLVLTTPNTSHALLLANVLLLFVFALIEARRYQVYATIKYRVRRIEKDYIAPLLNQIALTPQNLDAQPHVAPGLVESLLEYKSPISRFEALSLRLRRYYIYLLGITYIVWLNRVLINRVDQPWLEYVSQQAGIGSISGTFIFFLFAALMLTALVLSLYVPKMDEYFSSL